MKPPSRTTRWRQGVRKKRGMQSAGLGRRRLGRSQRARDAWFLNEAVIFSTHGRIPPRGAVASFRASGLSPTLLCVAAWYECRPTSRTRTQAAPAKRSISNMAKRLAAKHGSKSARAEAERLVISNMAKKLVAKYGGKITLDEAERLIAVGVKKNEPWVAEICGPDMQSKTWKPRTAACLSRELPISRRMISYWRAHSDYGKAARLVQKLRLAGNRL